MLLLNLLIAILSNTYTEFQPKSQALYYLEMAKLNNTKRWDQNYGALISAVPYFDLFLLPFIPFYIFLRKPKRLNSLLYRLDYLPILGFAILIFILLQVLLMPWAIIIAIATKFSLLMNKNTGEKGKVLLDLLFYIVFCIPLQVY